LAIQSISSKSASTSTNCFSVCAHTIGRWMARTGSTGIRGR